MATVGWFPKRRTILDDIAETEARSQVLAQRFAPSITPPEEPSIWQPPINRVADPELQPSVEQVTPTPPPIQELPPTALKREAPEPKENFWLRALQVFAAPFDWVDQNIIEPGLALTGTTAGFVPEVDRKPGEDFWEWKKRSWGGWTAPGVNLNVPWSDEPWRDSGGP